MLLESSDLLIAVGWTGDGWLESEEGTGKGRDAEGEGEGKEEEEEEEEGSH